MEVDQVCDQCSDKRHMKQTHQNFTKSASGLGLIMSGVRTAGYLTLLTGLIVGLIAMPIARVEAKSPQAAGSSQDVEQGRTLARAIFSGIHGKQDVMHLLTNAGVSTEALRVIEKDLTQRLPTSAKLPKMTLTKDEIYLDGVASGIQIVTYAPLKIRFENRTWMLNENHTSEDNYLSLTKFLETKKTSSAALSLIFPPARAQFQNGFTGLLSGALIGGLAGGLFGMAFGYSPLTSALVGAGIGMHVSKKVLLASVVSLAVTALHAQAAEPVSTQAAALPAESARWDAYSFLLEVDSPYLVSDVLSGQMSPESYREVVALVAKDGVKLDEIPMFDAPFDHGAIVYGSNRLTLNPDHSIKIGSMIYRYNQAQSQSQNFAALYSAVKALPYKNRKTAAQRLSPVERLLMQLGLAPLLADDFSTIPTLGFWDTDFYKGFQQFTAGAWSLAKSSAAGVANVATAVANGPLYELNGEIYVAKKTAQGIVWVAGKAEDAAKNAWTATTTAAYNAVAPTIANTVKSLSSLYDGELTCVAKTVNINKNKSETRSVYHIQYSLKNTDGSVKLVGDKELSAKAVKAAIGALGIKADVPDKCETTSLAKINDATVQARQALVDKLSIPGTTLRPTKVQ